MPTEETHLECYEFTFQLASRKLQCGGVKQCQCQVSVFMSWILMAALESQPCGALT